MADTAGSCCKCKNCRDSYGRVWNALSDLGTELITMRYELARSKLGDAATQDEIIEEVGRRTYSRPDHEILKRIVEAMKSG